MSPSSSGSWSGGQRADIIDLDRYMRGGIRPSRALSDEDNSFTDQLVVDAGGRRVSHPTGDKRVKQYSLDSGVSDGSYARRIRRPQRNDTFSNQGSHIRSYSHEPSARTNRRGDSSESLKAFRTVCEQVLIDQQRQISRVAELCERLTERVEEPAKTIERTERVGSFDRSLKRTKSKRSEKSLQERSMKMDHNRRGKLDKIDSVETTEISSSSRSTQDLREKDKSRTQDCKTYKIIMNKLDHLNRLFASGSPVRTRPLTSTETVSVCDKIVSTDTPRTVNRIMMPSVHVSTAGKPQSAPVSPKVTQVYRVDIEPTTQHRNNVITESVVKDESSNGASKDSVGDPRCGFDLDDPLHLFSQAKRLQALTATTAEPAGIGDTGPQGSEKGNIDSPVTSQSSARSPSLCAVCRVYWRYVRRCVAATLDRTDGRS